MKCIKCGAEVKSEFKICPYCGEPIQMVPDYSIYDEEDINVILEETKDVKSTKNKAYMKEEKERKEIEKRKAARQAMLKKKRNFKIMIAVAIFSVVLVISGVVLMVNQSNASSYSYQMKQADSAMFKGDIATAEKLYLKALSLSPNDIRVRLELAELYIEKGEKNTAIKTLEEVIKLDASNTDAYKLFYRIYSKDNDLDAIQDLLKDVTNSKILDLFSEYVIDKPRFSEAGGEYTTAVKLSLNARKGLNIYYTIDESDPRDYGTEYIQPIELLEEGKHVVKAVTQNKEGFYSDVVSETFMITFAAPEEPEVNPNGGTFTSATYIYVTVPTGCTAYYTWDRTDPTIESSAYASPLLVPEGYNVLSVIVVDDTSGLQSNIYRGAFEYYR